jgi:hypothetical protein
VEGAISSRSDVDKEVDKSVMEAEGVPGYKLYPYYCILLFVLSSSADTIQSRDFSISYTVNMMLMLSVHYETNTLK